MAGMNHIGDLFGRRQDVPAQSGQGGPDDEESCVHSSAPH